MRMKRAAAFTLAGLMAVSMTACGSGNGGSAKGSTSDSTEETKNEAAATAGKRMPLKSWSCGHWRMT